MDKYNLRVSTAAIDRMMFYGEMVKYAEKKAAENGFDTAYAWLAERIGGSAEDEGAGFNAEVNRAIEMVFEDTMQEKFGNMDV